MKPDLRSCPPSLRTRGLPKCEDAASPLSPSLFSGDLRVQFCCTWTGAVPTRPLRSTAASPTDWEHNPQRLLPSSQQSRLADCPHSVRIRVSNSCWQRMESLQYLVHPDLHHSPADSRGRQQSHEGHLRIWRSQIRCTGRRTQCHEGVGYVSSIARRLFRN